MKDKVKEIMRLSFRDIFFVDKSSQESNYEYLDALVDYVLLKEKSDDYEYIANKVWLLDSRIKNIFQLDMEIVSSYFDYIVIDETMKEHFLLAPNIEDLKKIARNSKNVIEFLRRIDVAMIFANWNNLNSKQQKLFLDNILGVLNTVFGVSIKKNICYKVMRLSENSQMNIALNEIICWLSNLLDFRFSHQTLLAIEMLEEFEKTEMYYQIGKELTEKRPLVETDEPINTILYNIIRPFSVGYIGDREDFLIELSKTEVRLGNAYVYIQDEFCKFVHSAISAKLKLSDELRKTSRVLTSKQTEVDELYKKITILQHQIEKMDKESARKITEAERQLKVMRNEVYSLREYVFERELKNVPDDEGECQVFDGDYSTVVIIGGHNKWQKKVAEQLRGINTVSTDQNVVDWSFLNHIEIIVIVTNYISHSMYYRVVDKVTDQELVYLDYKNIDQLKHKLNHLLVKNMTKE